MSKKIDNRKVITIKQAIDSFLLSCKVEDKSYGTIECYTDKLKGFLWYATTYHWSDNIKAITTDHLREFIAYLRETPHRFNSTCPRAMKPTRSGNNIWNLTCYIDRIPGLFSRDAFYIAQVKRS